MHKKLLLLISSFMIIFNLMSCGVKQVLELDENLHYVIEEVRGEDGLEGIYYQDQMYYIDKWNLFAVSNDSYNIDEGDIPLSWNGARFGYKKVFYSYTKDTPLFIYETVFDDVFFNKEYDYLSDTFVINGTDAEIVFSDIVSDLSQHTNVNLQEAVCIQLYSKCHPRIRMELDLECIDNQWYFCSSLSGSSPTWTASNAFVQFLSDNGII